MGKTLKIPKLERASTHPDLHSSLPSTSATLNTARTAPEAQAHTDDVLVDVVFRLSVGQPGSCSAICLLPRSVGAVGRRPLAEALDVLKLKRFPRGKPV